MVRRLDAPIDTAKFGGHGICQTLSKSKTVDCKTDDCKLIYTEVSRMMKALQVCLDFKNLGFDGILMFITLALTGS